MSEEEFRIDESKVNMRVGKVAIRTTAIGNMVDLELRFPGHTMHVPLDTDTARDIAYGMMEDCIRADMNGERSDD